MGVWGILGNHDHFIDPRRSEWALETAGIAPLINDGVTFERGGSSLALIGLEDLQARDGSGPDLLGPRKVPDIVPDLPFPPAPGLAPGGSRGRTPHPLRPHPRRADRPHRRNLNAARFSTRYIAGPYRREENFLYVSRGVGVGAVPVRVGAPPEIDLLTLRSTAVGARAAA